MSRFSRVSRTPLPGFIGPSYTAGFLERNLRNAGRPTFAEKPANKNHPQPRQRVIVVCAHFYSRAGMSRRPRPVTEACYEPKSILACRWTGFSPSRSRASLKAFAEMDSGSQRLGRPDVGKLGRTRHCRIPSFRRTPTTGIKGEQRIQEALFKEATLG
jgi:hypothetical protein